MKIIITEDQFKKLIESDETDHLTALKKTGFWGNAGAGCIIICENTGRILLPLRSDLVREPNTWGTWGGAIDNRESPIDSVKRELREECGYNGNFKIKPLHIFKHDSGFNYHNFLVIVEEEFKPVLNWETDKAYWFNLDELPKPLHFGLKGIFNNSSDMSIIHKYLKKQIKENKDYVYGNYNGYEVQAQNEDYDAVPFLYHENKVYLGYNPDLGYEYAEDGYTDFNGETNYPSFHSDIPGFYKYIYGDNNNMPFKNNQFRRKQYDYLGRLWFNNQIISFWKYPEDNNTMKKILNLIKKEMKEVYDFDINFDNYIIDINDGNSNNLISLKDYIKGNNATENELESIHTLPPNKKANTPQMKAVLSNKYKQIGDKLGNTSQAEYNFYKNYGIGDSYKPNKNLI